MHASGDSLRLLNRGKLARFLLLLQSRLNGVKCVRKRQGPVALPSPVLLLSELVAGGGGYVDVEGVGVGGGEVAAIPKTRENAADRCASRCLMSRMRHSSLPPTANSPILWRPILNYHYSKQELCGNAGKPCSARDGTHVSM